MQKKQQSEEKQMEEHVWTEKKEKQ